MTAPSFAMITESGFLGLKAGKQIDMVEDATDFLPDIGPGYGKNPSVRWQQIKRAKEAYWERNKARPAQAIKTGAISAADVNARLAAMPPVPLWGEEI